jgi:predicted aspartyl protease
VVDEGADKAHYPLEETSLLHRPRRVLILAFLLLASTAARDVAAAADPPRLSKPKPAPANQLPNVPPLPPAVFDPNLDISGEEVKARKVETRLSVEVQVNGRGPYKFIVDSGADTSAVGLRIARDLELPLGSQAILNGMTSRDIVDRVKVDALTLGPCTIRDLEIPALREVDLGGDGLIGIDALVRQRLMMDFEKRLIKVEDASKPMKIGPGDIVITARRQRGQLILTEVQASGLRLDAVIDTGSEISIGNLALRDKLVRKRTKIYEVEAIGVTGVHTKMQLARIDELQLGKVLIRDVPIAFADVPPFKLFGLANEPSLLLGTDILENFRRVSLDFRARKVRFQLRRCNTEGVLISTSQTEYFTRLSATAADVCVR